MGMSDSGIFNKVSSLEMELVSLFKPGGKGGEFVLMLLKNMRGKMVQGTL